MPRVGYVPERSTRNYRSTASGYSPVNLVRLERSRHGAKRPTDDG